MRLFCVFDRADPTFRPLTSATMEVPPVKADDEIVTFAFYLVAGLFTSFSNFFMLVLGK